MFEYVRYGNEPPIIILFFNSKSEYLADDLTAAVLCLDLDVVLYCCGGLEHNYIAALEITEPFICLS